jgi:GST-like protein
MAEPKQYQVYSLATPNGIKIGIALYELDLPFDAHTIDIRKQEQFAPSFLEKSPNNKIPAIVDLNGPGGKPLALFESGAILIYLAEKTGKLLPADPVLRYKTIQWLMWQMAGFGPMLGQMGHFHKYAKDDIPYAKQRYFDEAQRLFGVLDKQLSENKFVVGDEYTIADIAIWPWVLGVDKFYGFKAEFSKYAHVARWFESIGQREAVKKGLTVCPFP